MGRRRWLLPVAGVATAFTLYKLHRNRNRISSLLQTLKSLSTLLSSSSSTLSLLSSDLHRFLLSDSDHLPPSLLQLSKLASSDSTALAVSRLSEAVTAGIAAGVGSGLAGRGGGGGSGDVVVEVLCGEKVRVLVEEMIRVFVSTSVEVYLDKTMDVNVFNDVFAGLTNSNYDAKMRDLIVSVSNGAVETLVKTSHEVLTGSAANGGGMLSALAVTGNRRFVIDVVVRTAFELVESFFEFMVVKVSESGRRSVGFVRKEVLERGLEMMRYLSAKMMIVFAICLALCLRVVAERWALLQT